MAARGALKLLCLFALGLVLCGPRRQTRVIYGAVNGSVTFPVVAPASFREILWKKGQYPVIQWKADTQPESRTFWLFVGRTSLDTESGDLTIYSLTHSDEDEYELESPDIKDNIKFRLKVIDPLPSMTLNCTWTGDTITIRCGLKEPDLPHADLLWYSWLCSGAPCPNDTRASEMYLEKNRPPEEVTCVVRNPLSERNSSMDAATCVPVNRWGSWWFLLPAVLLVCLPAAIGGYRCINRVRSVSAAPVAGTKDDALKCVKLISSPPASVSTSETWSLESEGSELLACAKERPLEFAAGTLDFLSRESLLPERGDSVPRAPVQTPPYGSSSSLSPAGLRHPYPRSPGSLGLPGQLPQPDAISSAAEEASTPPALLLMTLVLWCLDAMVHTNVYTNPFTVQQVSQPQRPGAWRKQQQQQLTAASWSQLEAPPEGVSLGRHWCLLSLISSPLAALGPGEAPCRPLRPCRCAWSARRGSVSAVRIRVLPSPTSRSGLWPWSLGRGFHPTRSPTRALAPLSSTRACETRSCPGPWTDSTDTCPSWVPGCPGQSAGAPPPRAASESMGAASLEEAAGDSGTSSMERCCEAWL